MVCKVSPPSESSVDVVRNTLNERIRYTDFYNKIRDDLLGNVVLYSKVGGDPEKITPMVLRKYTTSDKEAEERKISLIGLYSPKKDKLPYLQIENIRKHNGLVICPSCGELGRPRTLDHYLPKDIFPEFSITLLNLTPMCDWCQGEKGCNYLNSDKKKIFIHPYFDDVNVPLFSIVFTQPYDAPRISYLVESGLPLEMQNLVLRHLKGINFLERYLEYFKTKYVSILRNANNCRISGSNSIYDTLKTLKEAAEFDGINSWDAVLYRSILSDTMLLDFLKHGTLPAHL